VRAFCARVCDEGSALWLLRKSAVVSVHPGTAKPSTMNTYTKKGRGVGGENEQAPSFFAELREPYAQYQADGRL
jgi:hypothetical protein